MSAPPVLLGSRHPRLSDLKSDLSLQGRFSRDVLWNVGSLGVLGASGVVINSVILAVQGQAALGVFNQVFAFYVVTSQLAVGGLQFSALKHCSYNQDDMRECSNIASSALMLVAAVSLAVGATLWELRGLIGRMLESEAVSLGIAFSIPALLLFSINKVLIMSINGLRHMRAFAMFQALRYVLILCGVVVVMALRYPGSHLALSLLFSEVVLFVGLALYVHLRVFRLSFSFSAEHRAWMRRHVSFGLRGFLSGVLVEMNTRVDILILGYYLTDAAVGVYSFASTFAEGFAQLTTVMRQNIDPVVGRAFSQGDKEKIRGIARKVRRTFVPVMIMLGIAAAAAFPLLVFLLGQLGPDKGDYRSWGVFAILLCGTVMASGYRPFLSILLQGGRPGAFTLLMTCSVLANAILCFCLVPVLRLYGASLATATVYVLEAAAIVVLAKRLFGIQL